MVEFYSVAVILLYCFATGTRSTKFVPPIIFQENDAVVNTGDNLTLTCQGPEPLTWTIVNYKRINYDTNLITKNEMNEDISQLPYGSILRIQNVSYLNTGFFYCHGRKVNKDDITRSTNIYVYVRDELRLSILSPEDLAVFAAKRRTMLTIPCLPTSPDVTVALLNADGKEVARDANSFDPHTGFMIRMLFEEEDVYCVFTRNNQNENFTIFLDESSLPEIETSLVYETNDKYFAYVGDTLVLHCSIILPYSSFYQYKWTLNFNEIEKNNRISILNKPLISIANGKLFTSSLIINNVTVRDDGQYECLAIVLSSTARRVSTYITVTDITTEITPPKINFTGSVIIINAQESLTLVCTGTEPITWFTDDYYIPMDNISITTYKESKYIYKAILTISNANVEIAGSYICRSEHVKNNNPYRTRQIFIYVKDQNSLTKFVGDSGGCLLNKRNTKLMIPCIASSPDISVSLIDSKGHKINSDLAIHFPKLGFDYYGRDQGSREYKCLYQRGNITQELNISIYVVNDPTYELTHFIEVPDKESIYKGQDLRLNCSMIIYDAVMFNYSGLFLNWTIPDSLETGNNILIHDEESYALATGKVLIKKLTVKNTTFEAEGYYDCVLYDSSLNIVDTLSKYITVLEQITAEVIINIPERQYIVTSETLTLYYNVKVNHNAKFTLHWHYHRHIQNMKRISQTTLKIEEDISGLIGRISLTIKNVTLADTGIYKCTMKNDEDFSKSVERNLTIHEPKSPDIFESNLNTSEWKVQEGKTIDLYCKAIGIPVPLITWIKNDHPWVIEKSETRIIIQNNNTSVKFIYTRKEDEGKYMCRASNIAGEVEKEIKLTILTDPTKWTPTLLTFVVILLIILTVLFIILIKKVIKEKKRKREFEIAGLHEFEQGAVGNINPNLGVDSQADLLPYDKSFEIPREKLKLGKQLGSGFFGVVIQADAINIFPEEHKKIVAVKMVKRGADYSHIKALLCELKIMIHLGKHLNVVNLLGACTRNISKRELLVVVEYCRHGNILDILLKCRNTFINQIDPRTGCFKTSIGQNILKYYASGNNSSKLLPQSNYYNVIESDGSYSNITKAQAGILQTYSTTNNVIKPVCTHDLLCWSFQVAEGMSYLASKKVLHGDLAARNILLADDNIVKICDFGLAKNIYKYNTYKKKTNGPLPVKWMAPESITHRVFSTQSDVWSYGIVLWELFSLGRTPYPEVEVNQEFYDQLLNGYRMSQPEYSINEIYQIMIDCWKSSPYDRPSFNELSERIGSLLTTNELQNYIELNRPYANMNNTQFKNKIDFLGKMMQSDCNKLTSTSNLCVNKNNCSKSDLNKINADSTMKNNIVVVQYSTLDFQPNIPQDDDTNVNNFEKRDSNSGLHILTANNSGCDTIEKQHIL